jgi:hypothetical protein
MKKFFLVLIAAGFVASGSGLSIAQTSEAKPSSGSSGKTRSSPPKNDVKSIPKPPPQPCIEKGCQLGTPQVVR